MTKTYCEKSTVKSETPDYQWKYMSADTVRSCKAGTFRGSESAGCIHFRGIRYAESERYCAPVPYVYPEGVHDCCTPCPYCIQDEARIEGRLIGMYYEKLPQTESCQFLSITVPEDAGPGSKKPVMVWYHGGAYKNGGCENDVYDREPLVTEQDVILVGVNYRLGITGFVRDIDGNLSNNGLLDAIEGLRWVKENIEGFGGDPENITVFGQSAGADIVRCLLLSGCTDGLFARAIMQSAPIGTMTGREDMDRKALEELNTHPTDIAPKELLDVQRSILAHVTEKGPAKEMVFGPHYGVYPLPKEEDIPARLKEVASGHPLLIGSNTREVMAYVAGEEKLERMYQKPVLKRIIDRKERKQSQKIFIAPTKAFAEMYAECGGTAYLYEFHWIEDTYIGSCHGSELPLLFGVKGFRDHKNLLGGVDIDEVTDIGRSMRKMWADFARDGSMDVLSIDGVLDAERL